MAGWGVLDCVYIYLPPLTFPAVFWFGMQRSLASRTDAWGSDSCVCTDTCALLGFSLGLEAQQRWHEALQMPFQGKSAQLSPFAHVSA